MCRDSPRQAVIAPAAPAARPYFADLCYGAYYLHTVASRQAIEERAVEESGRTDTATSAGEGTEYVPGLGSALRSLDDNPESPSLASAAAAVITARWRRTDGSAWTPPEQRHAARDTPTGPDPAPRPTSHTARGSAPVPGLARPYPPDNGKGNPYPGAAPGRPPARVEPIPVQRTPGVPVEPPTGPLIAESLVEPAPFATKAPFPPMPPDPGPLDPGLLHPASLDPASLDPTSLDPAPLDPAPLDQASPAPGSSAPHAAAASAAPPMNVNRPFTGKLAPHYGVPSGMK